MKAALQAHYSAADMDVHQAFAALDEDNSGYLDKSEVEQVRALQGGLSTQPKR